MQRIVALFLCVAMAAHGAQAQSLQGASSPQNIKKMQQLTGAKDPGRALNQIMIISIVMGCAQKRAGKDATQALFSDLQSTGNAVEAYCKEDKGEEARTLVLSTLEQKRNDPAMQAALSCYDSQTASIQAMGGKELSDAMARYVNWVRNPGLAAQQMTTTDICKPQAATKKEPAGK